MPIKVKKDKAKQKQKQKQRQSQVVNIKIGDVKKQAIRRRKRETKAVPVQQTVQPVQYLYQATGSMPYQNVGVSQPLASANILGRENPVPAKVLGKADPLEIGKGSEARGNLLGGPRLTREEIRDRLRSIASMAEQQPPSSIYPDIPRYAPSEVSTEIGQYGFPPASSLSGGGSAVSSVTDIPTRTPRAYRNKPTLIREILRATGEFTAGDLQAMTTNEVRDIYDRFYP